MCSKKNQIMIKSSLATSALLFFCHPSLGDPCDHSHLTLDNQTGQILNIRMLDSQNSMEPLESTLSPHDLLVRKITGIAQELNHKSIRILLTTEDQQTIEFTAIFTSNLFTKRCHAYLLAGSVEFSDPGHYMVSEQAYHGKPAILDIKVLSK
jgi:hypothetical protein